MFMSVRPRRSDSTTLIVRRHERILRDRAALFLALGFPVVHLILFGLVLGGGVGPTTTTVGVVGSGEVVSGESDVPVQRVRFADREHAVRAVESGVLQVAVVQDGDRVTIYYAAGHVKALATARGVALSDAPTTE